MAKSDKKYQSKKKRSRSNSSPGIWVVTILGGILLIVAALVAFGNSGSKGPKVPVTVNGQPSIKVDKEKVDLGDMKFNALANVSFTIANEGDETLRIIQEPHVEVVEGC
jgi:paraquat-inducible protein B